MHDVVGVGANSVDRVYRLPQFPRPDSPAAKLRISAHRVSYGGQTATTLCTCATMGLRTKYVGATGSDAHGAQMREELGRRGVDITAVVVRQCANPYAVILLDERQGDRIVLWDRSPALQLRAEEVGAALRERPRLIHVDDADEDAAVRAALLGRNAGIPVTSDVERVTARTEELVAAVTIPIFAEHALESFTGEADPERALRKVLTVAGPTAGQHPGPSAPAPRTMVNARMVVVTLGARGAMLVEGDRACHEPALPILAVDTTGAGDVFRGALIAALLRGDAPADMLRFANAAAAVSCTREGAIDSVPTAAEVEALLREQTA
ncbi:MAG: hypothetical protein A3F70_10590 [Acidobacteria bacterium RIFCSPLOWO2_12_FULL_67_14]|nr:MAG: hypothetical protein A3F70_10590 [Acidobacteria bacterium RIFCSPLOWO2_12_FULL_67_14]